MNDIELGQEVQEYYGENIETFTLADQLHHGGKNLKKLPKKEILGKMRCIYKIPGDRKEYVKHKGKLITIKDYKELMKAKKPSKSIKPTKSTKSKKK